MRRMEIVKWIIPFVLVSVLGQICLAAQKDATPARSIDELRQQLEKALAETHTPGVSVAIVHRDGPEWVAGLGKADVASGRATTAETLFRIGSTSKGFASLSILMLADQGKLSLDDPVHKLAPEVWFENRWEASDPVRVVQLLEHTTGWDDVHPKVMAHDDPRPLTLAEGLALDPDSRTSRWRPGTFYSYSNAGPPVAAVGEGHQESGVGDASHPREKPFRFERSRGPPRMQPTSFMNSCVPLAARAISS